MSYAIKVNGAPRFDGEYTAPAGKREAIRAAEEMAADVREQYPDARVRLVTFKFGRGCPEDGCVVTVYEVETSRRHAAREPHGVRESRRFDDFTRQYLETALWSTNDNSEEPLDKNYGIDDIEPETLEKMIADCADFQVRYAALLASSGIDDGQAGHWFWLSRNGHGSGFFDEDHDALQEAAAAYQEFNLYVDDGMIHGFWILNTPWGAPPLPHGVNEARGGAREARRGSPRAGETYRAGHGNVVIGARVRDRGDFSNAPRLGTVSALDEGWVSVRWDGDKHERRAPVAIFFGPSPRFSILSAGDVIPRRVEAGRRTARKRASNGRFVRKSRSR